MNKKLLALLVAALMTVTFMVGCSKNDEKAPETTETTGTETKPEEKTDEKADAPEEKKDEEAAATEERDADQYINSFESAWPNTFDPSTGSDMYGNNVLLNVLEPLVRVDEKEENGQLVNFFSPAGAESWEVSEDGTVYTFKIRKGNKWDDGQEVTAKDYEFGVRRSALPETASPFANILFALKNGEAVFTGEKPVEELGVEAPDDYTLVLTLEHPVPYFMDLVIQRVFFPQRADYVEKYGDQYSTDIGNIPMCGPFLLTDMTINSEINYVKNPDFWNAENVNPERVHVAIMNDTNTINNSLMTGEIDYSGVGDPNVQQQLKESGEYNLLQRDNAWTGYFMVNFNENSRVANTKITRAIAAVLDRQEVIDSAMNGIPLPAWSFVPPAVSCQGVGGPVAFNEKETGPAKRLIEDIEDPKALFAEGVKELGGDPENYTIRLMGSDTSDNGRISIEAFQQQIEEGLGVKVEASNQDWNAFINIINGGDFDLAWLAWGADFNDPSNFLETCYSKTAAYPTGWVNKEFDECIEKAQAETDAAKRAELLHRAEEILIYEDAALIPINHSVANIFRKKYIHGTKDTYFSNMGFQSLYTIGR
ncbi:MAG: peptide ABC transporter substrate-binding protein [Ezakiella sp.]|nr:peptide ABC transporter substrate-binding protein [Ezakiella sp.]